MKRDAYAALFANPAVHVTTRSDGTVYLTSAQPLDDYADKLGEFLALWARRTPKVCFLAERDATGSWQRLTYGEALVHVEAVAQSLIDHGLSVDHPLMILSGNSIKTALLLLAAMHVGVPVVPVSPPYALMSKDYSKLKYLAGLIRPRTG